MKRLPLQSALALAIGVSVLLNLGLTTSFAREIVNKNRLFDCTIKDSSEVGEDGKFESRPFHFAEPGDRLWFDEASGILRVAGFRYEGFVSISTDPENSLVATRLIKGGSHNEVQVIRIMTVKPLGSGRDGPASYPFLYVGTFTFKPLGSGRDGPASYPLGTFSVLFAGLCTVA